MEYFLNKDLVIANGKVYFEGEDLKTKDNIIDKIKSDLSKGNLRGDINEIIVHMMSEFYYLMWSKKNQWQTTLKNRK